MVAANNRASYRAFNDAFFAQLESGGLTKQAADGINDFTRTTMREEGIARKVMPPLPLSNDELDRNVTDDKPFKVIDKEPGSPAAISVSFGQLPDSIYVRGPRYAVQFARILSPRFIKDVDELRSWHMDIRQVMSDNSLKDMLAEEDSKFFGAFNLAIGGSADTVVPVSGVAQWETISGGITRETIQDARKIMPRTPFHLEAATAIVNNVTIKECEKFGRDEMGGDFSETVFRNGWAEAEFAKMRWLITIKRSLVPDDSMFMFADPKFLGKSFTLEDTVMWIKREGPMVEWYAYETLGSTFGHVGGLARADFV